MSTLVQCGTIRIHTPSVNVIFSTAASTEEVRHNTLILGQKNGGSAEENVPYLVLSADRCISLFGEYSSLTQDFLAFQKEDPYRSVTCICTPVTGLTPGVATITFNANITIPESLSLIIQGVLISIVPDVGDDGLDIAQKFEDAVAGNPSCGCTAMAVGPVLTLTTVLEGQSLGFMSVATEWGDIAPQYAVENAYSAAIAITQGTGVPDLSATFLGLGEEKYRFIVCPFYDAQSQDMLSAYLCTTWGPADKRLSHGFTARGDLSFASFVTTCNSENDPHRTLITTYGLFEPPHIICARVVGKLSAGYAQNASLNTNFVQLLDIKTPKISIRPTKAEVENILAEGGTPWIVLDGDIVFPKIQNVYNRTGSGVADSTYKIFDDTMLEIACAEFVTQSISKRYENYKIRTDNSVSTINSGQKIVSLKTLQAFVQGLGTRLEQQGIIDSRANWAQNVSVSWDGQCVRVVLNAKYVKNLNCITVNLVRT